MLNVCKQHVVMVIIITTTTITATTTTTTTTTNHIFLQNAVRKTYKIYTFSRTIIRNSCKPESTDYQFTCDYETNTTVLLRSTLFYL